MRPVNLIPRNERRGDATEARTGPIAYLLIGGLVAILAGVCALVLTGNEISENQSRLERLEAEHAAEKQRAEELAAYTQFRSVREQRTMTVASLADSRFDWERVIRELSLVMPPDVWLTEMRATVSPTATLEGAQGVQGREAVSGPALELIGCAPGQEAVARFVSIMKDVDGVTRVGLPSSSLPAGDSASGETGGDCQTRDFIARFEMIVAFDAAPVAATAAAPPVVAPTDPAATTTTTTETG